MNIKNVVMIVLLSFSMLIISASNKNVLPPKACGPVPNANQMRWHEMETYAFLHYSLNTYTGQEWGYGDEDIKLFNPKHLDARQWVRTCKEAGMKGIILTAKHHGGFCLWPSAYTEYSVKNAPWKDGKGDVVRELSDACKEYGLKFAVYLSPWDRNYAEYGHLEYITYFRNQLRELLSNYGEQFEVWFDGANGGTGYYGGAREKRDIDRNTYYDWPNTFKMIRELQPRLVIWNGGGDLRWIGNEKGFSGIPNWARFTHAYDNTNQELMTGKENGDVWQPGEADVSIRPGWFYHEKEDSKVKTLRQLMDIYYKSVGRNASLLLNFPITPDGLIHKIDSVRGAEFAREIKNVFANNLAKGAKIQASNVRGKSKKFSAINVVDGDTASYWATDDNVKNAFLIFTFNKPIEVNRFVAQEYIRLGQRVKKFRLDALVNNRWIELKDELAPDSVDGLQTIGYKRIICFSKVKAKALRFTIIEAEACPVIESVGIYLAREISDNPLEQSRKADVDFILTPIDNHSVFIDLKREGKYKTFEYLPLQADKEGLVSDYILYISKDGNNWIKINEGEFSNIENNSIVQSISLPNENMRYIKFVAKRLVKGSMLKWERIKVSK